MDINNLLSECCCYVFWGDDILIYGKNMELVYRGPVSTKQKEEIRKKYIGFESKFGM
jgi:hypothetical protein